MVEITKMYLVRNGGSDTERPGQFVGQLDLPLSRRGEERIMALLSIFEGETIHKVYTSPLLRASMSGRIFSEAFGCPTLVNENLMEISLGEFEGKTFEEIEADSPELARNMGTDPVKFRYPGGESFMDLAERAYRAFWEIATRSEGKTVVIFSHGGVNRTIIASLLGMAPEGIFKLEQDPGGMSLVEVLNRFPRIRFLNVSVR